MTGLLFSSIQYLHSDLVMSRVTRAIVPTYYVDPSYQVIEHTYRIALIVNDQKLDFLDDLYNLSDLSPLSFWSELYHGECKIKNLCRDL